MTTEIQEYSRTEAALADLAQKYKGVVFEVSTPAGMKSAKEARADIRTYRTSLEKMRVQIKEPALRRCQLIDSEAKRITAALVALEEPIDQVIKQEEERKENIRLAAEIEAKRKEEEKLAAERAEIARRQAELDRAEREREEAGRQARLKIEAEERAARERIEAAERQARLAREEEDRKVRAARQAQEDQLRAEREALDKAKREQEDRARADRDAREQADRALRAALDAKKRAEERKAAELADARGMLDLFVERYSKIEEFSVVISAIKQYQQSKEPK